MGSLTHQGLVVPSDPLLKSELTNTGLLVSVTDKRNVILDLTVRPVENAMGIRPPAFKVFRVDKDSLLVPRYFGSERFGTPTDARAPPAPARITFNGTLRTETHQDRAFAAGIKAFEEVGGGVLSLPPGYGKCLGKDTPVMMHDGSTKMVQDIRVGELLMGDDSSPRTVLSTCTGYEQLYRVVPVKGDSYVVNESHILSLRCNDSKSKKNGQVVDISVTEYLNLSNTARWHLKGYRVPVIFTHKDVPLDPYMVGYWLGDGSSACAVISSQESVVLKYFDSKLKEYNLTLDYTSQYDYRIKGPKPNYFYKTLQDLDLINNKHIPSIYKYNSRDIQLQVLAGLLDSDGSAVEGGWDITLKSEKLMDDLVFLARSLGFAAYKKQCQKTCTNAPGGPKTGTYYRCSIFGQGVEDVPCKVGRKQLDPRVQIKNVLNVGIHLEKIDVGQYFGFEIDGNRRFVLGDFTVTHNTAMALAFSAHLKVRTIIIVHKEFLANQWKERIQQFCPGATIGRIQQDTFDVEKDFVIAMIQTLCMREVGSLNQFGFLIVDEAHHIGAAAFSQSMFKICPKFTLGLTATPERKDGLTRLLYWFMGPAFYTFQRENQKTTRVETVYYQDDHYKTMPPTNKFGKINMAEMVTQISELNSRNELIVDIIKNCLGDGRRILVLSDRREHCLWVNSQFESEMSGLYIGGMTEAELNETAKKKVIVATFAMAQEGLDIPVLDTCILTSPHSDVTQAVGRIMRETAGKANSPLIYDIVDRWSLFYAMYNKRLAFYKRAGFQCGNSEETTQPKKRLLDEGKCAFI